MNRPDQTPVVGAGSATAGCPGKFSGGIGRSPSGRVAAGAPGEGARAAWTPGTRTRSPADNAATVALRLMDRASLVTPGSTGKVTVTSGKCQHPSHGRPA